MYKKRKLETVTTLTNAIKEEYIATHEQVIKNDVGDMIDDVVVDIIREALKKEIGGHTND